MKDLLKIIKQQGQTEDFDAIRIGFIGSFFGLFAFGIIGSDTLRAFYVTRQAKDRMPEAICSVVADRIVGLITMFSFASVAFLLLDFEIRIMLSSFC